MHRWHMQLHQRTHTNGLDQPAQIHQAEIGTLSHQCFQIPHIYHETLTLKSFNDCIHFIYISKLALWLPHNIGFSHSIWNATVTAPQFWMADLKSHILSNVMG